MIITQKPLLWCDWEWESRQIVWLLSSAATAAAAVQQTLRLLLKPYNVRNNQSWQWFYYENGAMSVAAKSKAIKCWCYANSQFLSLSLSPDDSLGSANVKRTLSSIEINLSWLHQIAFVCPKTLREHIPNGNKFPAYRFARVTIPDQS